MKIGIVGLGVVGSACRSGFERCGYEVIVHDIKLDTDLSDVLDTEICYVCVPTPSNEDGSCNTDIVELVVARLHDMNYKGVTAIKSTIEPGTTQRFIEKYNDRIVFVPEFLKERSAEYDFIFDHKLLLVGSDNINHAYLVQRSHGDLPKSFMRVSPTEAEMMKYYHNVFNATRITFANVFYEMCEATGADYNKVKEAFLKNNTMPDEYLDVSKDLRGYGGACLPKDVKAAQQLCNKYQLNLKLFEVIAQTNDRFDKTVFEGMRG